MKINALFPLVYLFMIIFIANSCIINNQSAQLAEDTSLSSQDTQEEASVQDYDPDPAEEAAGKPSDDLSDIIIVDSPTPDQLISSPLIIEGKARGTWFFEATFPVKLLDYDGNVIMEYYAQTDEEWMTEDFISFRAELSYERPATDTGTLLLIKANPSDIREYDAQIEIPVRFR